MKIKSSQVQKFKFKQSSKVQSKARQGMARQGKARQGMARQGKGSGLRGCLLVIHLPITYMDSSE